MAIKDETTENFPVASRLLRPELRRPVLAFYRFARAADDIADSPLLAAPEKLRRLTAFAAGLWPGAPEAELLEAFRWDAENRRYADWDGLLGYCRRSAAPVARFLLELHGEGAPTERPGAALAMALQVLNHLQDCGEDWRRLGRLYLPEAWLAEAGAYPQMLEREACTPALRVVIDRLLAATALLIEEAAPLPALVRDPGLAAQSAATLLLARRLHRRLAAGDPLAERIRLGRLDWAAALWSALRRRVA